MDGTRPDGELTEFRPWSHFESPSERDWRPLAAGAAAVLILGAGWLVWRTSQSNLASEASPVVEATATVPAPTASPEATVLTESVRAEPASTEPASTETAPPALLSEADLMALVPGAADLTILAVAEEAVVAHFTAAPSADTEAPAYVEWARAIELRTEGAVSTVKVRFSVVTVSDTPWRLPVRTVEILVGEDQAGWSVEGLPRFVEDPFEVRWEEPELTDVPPSVRAEFEKAGWTVMGGVEREEGWDVAVADSTGAAMIVFSDGGDA